MKVQPQSHLLPDLLDFQFLPHLAGNRAAAHISAVKRSNISPSVSARNAFCHCTYFCMGSVSWLCQTSKKYLKYENSVHIIAPESNKQSFAWQIFARFQSKKYKRSIFQEMFLLIARIKNYSLLWVFCERFAQNSPITRQTKFPPTMWIVHCLGISSWNMNFL